MRGNRYDKHGLPKPDHHYRQWQADYKKRWAKWNKLAEQTLGNTQKADEGVLVSRRSKHGPPE